LDILQQYELAEKGVDGRKQTLSKGDDIDKFPDTKQAMKLVTDRYQIIKNDCERLTETLQLVSDRQKEFFESLLRTNVWLGTAESIVEDMKSARAGGDPAEPREQIAHASAIRTEAMTQIGYVDKLRNVAHELATSYRELGVDGDWVSRDVADVAKRVATVDDTTATHINQLEVGNWILLKL